MKDLTGTFISAKGNDVKVVVIAKASKRSNYYSYLDGEDDDNWCELKEVEKRLKGRTLIRLGGVTRGPARQKPLSRSGRLFQATGAINTMIAEVQDMVPADTSIEDEALLEKINERLTGVDVCVFEDLKEELESWKENIEEKFSNTQKYSDLEEAISNLESGINDLESIHEASDFDDIQNVINDIENALSTLEDTMFPGMF